MEPLFTLSQGTVAEGMRNSLVLKALKVSLLCMAQLILLHPYHSDHLDSLSLLGQKTCSVLVFFLMSIHVQRRGRWINLQSPKWGRTADVLKTVRKNTAQALIQYQLAQ